MRQQNGIDLQQDWIDLQQDTDTGIETIQAHFEGHAYDPHWHDSYLVGVTRQGVQQFHCRRSRHQSTPGKVFLLEPGEIHDGEAPARGGFTYSTLYLDPAWLDGAMRAQFDETPSHYLLTFGNTLTSDVVLSRAIAHAFAALHDRDPLIVRQAALDALLARLTAHVYWRQRPAADPRQPVVARQARDYLHAHLGDEVSLDDLTRVTGVDRFRLTRAFKAAYGLAPHAYLIQLRLARARVLLAQGVPPARTAADLGFADQSHLGRWFRRAYRLTPARYFHCTNLPD
ncbi:MAG: AraC family transcriptional regulator [Paludibacterium sp.]|uniref:AraC family transcriptional regulator n=1 Tax=Paludibacterium sp. TaxID=1917523 RepID=UPI0025D65C01|nr:AraC family transcriptional regulator [Paludibacterium sp.]MBV8049087.1 AraC family transcriptional regulator [Paludibacterium sp.]MBV8649403.1 AraC family transcriptional regulator [Paludibacterium sp.]